MPATGGYSMDNLFRYPFIIDRITRIAPTSMAMSTFYGQGISVTGGKEPRMTSGNRRSRKREIVFDITNNTRRTNTYRPPGAGPSYRNPQKIGQVMARALRFYDARPFTYDEIDEFRTLGSSRVDLVDEGGLEYLTYQMDDLVRSALNGREFAFVQMLKGGFKIAQLGNDEWLPVPSNYSSIDTIFDVDYQVPDSHKSQLALGTAGANLITADWSTPSTDIAEQIRNLRAVAVERSGYPITHMWCNTTILNELLSNTALQAAGGSAFKVFDAITGEEVSVGQLTQGTINSKQMLMVKLRALPEITVMVYDDGWTLPFDNSGSYNVEDQIHDPGASTADKQAGGKFVKAIADDEVIFTPPPSTGREWIDTYAVHEIIQKNYESPQESLYGLGAWWRRKMEPTPSIELHVLDNYCPALKNPYAIYNPTVTGF